MKPYVTYSILFVALLHLCFLVLEMFMWNQPIGWRVFNNTPEFAKESTVLAANMGLYNGFLAAGLVWGVLGKRTNVTLFCLICVIVAGIFGAITVKPTIFVVQSLPAIVALSLAFLMKPKPVVKH
jgi:putative membrane protein